MVKVGINGFGRIGRIALRIMLQKHKGDISVCAINTSGSMNVDGWAHLVNYDTTYRKFGIEIDFEKVVDVKDLSGEDPLIGYLLVKSMDLKIPVLAQREPDKIPWGKYGAEVIIESTGKFTTSDEAKRHAVGGAKRVVISAPAKGGNVNTYVLGVNDYDGAAEVLSNASCTTNCIAPVAAVMHAKFGIKKAMMTTIHGYTDDQNLQDNSHKDLRRARAAAENIIPTTTGAAVATTETIPALVGLFDGAALRVPVLTGSITDLTLLLSRSVTKEEINQAFIDASQNALYKGILGVSDKPLVSSDIIGSSESAIVDLSLTQVVAGDFVKIFAWYDNEWGYANRLVEQVIRVGLVIEKNTVPSDPISLTFKAQG